jgi:hypothetical protein
MKTITIPAITITPSRVIAAVALAAATGLGAAACTHSAPNATQVEAAAQNGDTTALIQSQPIPHLNYSQERQVLIVAEKIAANATPTTTFFWNYGVQDPYFACPSLGLGVPDSASLSNPHQVVPVTGRWGGGHDTLDQMEPFGVYAPPSSTGTYVICVNPRGQEYLKRAEGPTDTTTAGMTWDYKTHREVMAGGLTLQIKTKKK